MSVCILASIDVKHFTFEILYAMVTINHRKIEKATVVSLLGVHWLTVQLYAHGRYSGI